MKKIPVYDQLWFIITLFVIGPFLLFIPTVIAIAFLFQRQTDFPNLTVEEKNIIDNKINDIRKEADNIISTAKTEKAEIEKSMYDWFCLYYF